MIDDAHRGLVRRIAFLRRMRDQARHERWLLRMENERMVMSLAGAVGHQGVNRRADWKKLIASVLRQRAALAEARLEIDRLKSLVPVSSTEENRNVE